MSPARVLIWLRRRTPVELGSLVAGVLVLGWLGWDLPLWDPRLQLVLHLIAALAIAGLGLWALRGGEVPRTPLDLPILALVAAYAAATASAMNHGMSLRAVAGVLATAAVLPIALIAIRHRPGWVGAVAAVPVLVLSVPALVSLAARRIEWIAVGAPGLPPLRLLNEGTPFGSVAVPPFVIWPAWALAGLIESGPWRRAIRTGLVVVGVPLTVLSGSRSAWLAIGMALLIGVVPWAWRRRERVWHMRQVTARSVLVAIGVLAVAGLAAVVVIPRLTAVASLVYRATLWRDTLAAWSTDPLLGIGPGFMPYARQAAAPDFSFPVRQPHSHNVPLGVLGDSGMVGLAAGVVVVVVALFVAGPWRSRTATGRHASIVLLGLGIGSLFEDLTFLPNFNLLAIGLLAVALTDAGAVGWLRPTARPTRRRLATAAAALAMAVSVAPAVVLGDAGAIAHASGVAAFEEGRHAAARDDLGRALELDPWHPAAPKALAIAAARSGDSDAARRAAELAVALGPGDGPAWTNLAILCHDAGDAACAGRAAERAVATASFLGLELANAARIHEGLGQIAAADDAYRRSLLSQRLTAFGLSWPRQVGIEGADLPEDYGALGELNRVLAGWAVDEPLDPSTIADPAVRALAHALAGEAEAAAPLLEQAITATPDDPLPWQVAIVLRDAWGEPVEDELRAWHALTGRPFPGRDDRPAQPVSTDDIASFRRYPGDELVTGAERLETDPIWPWILRDALP